MDRYRIAALVLAVGLLFAAATDYVPAFIDSEGRVFGLFHLDIYKDALHVASGLWALAAACSRRFDWISMESSRPASTRCSPKSPSMATR